MGAITISLPSDVEKEIRELAKKERRTIGGQISYLLDYFKKNNK
jgi:hypothetical protein